jgi:6-phosphogluconolactonase
VNCVKFAASLLMLSAPAWGASVSGYIGTLTSHGAASNGSVGIYSFHWNSVSGSLGDIRTAALTDSPSFLAIHPNGKFLYAVNEGGFGEAGRITAFAIGKSRSAGQLRDLGSVSSMGMGPCHLSLDSSARWLFVANYRSGSIAVYPIRADGTLGEAQQAIQQQDLTPSDGGEKTPHAHEVVQSPDGRFVLSVDLGLDKIFVYRFDALSGSLTANDPPAMQFPPGYGPRHLIFSKDARELYVLTELTAKLITLSWDATRGSLVQLAESSVLPAGSLGPPSGAELALSANGRFIYASNRAQSNSIAAFRLGPDGNPTPIGSIPSGGTTPRFIIIAPSGRFLLAANQGSNDIATFRIDPASGALTPTANEAHVAAPVDIVFLRNIPH